MCTKTKIETRRRFVVAIVASLVAAVTFAVPQAWQTTLTQAIMPSAEAVDRFFYRPTVWYVAAGEKVVSVGVSTAVPVTIPDNDRKGLSIPIEVSSPHSSGNPVATRVEVYLDIKHGHVNDLVATLTSPDKHTVELFHRLAPYKKWGDEYCSHEGMKITLVETPAESKRLDGSQCPSASEEGEGFIKGLFYTRGRIMKEFNGGPASGTWILNISDHSRNDTGNDIGTFRNASLTIVSVAQ